MLQPLHIAVKRENPTTVRLLLQAKAPAFLLRSIGGLNDKSTQQAWREKMALVIIIAVLCGVIGFATVGLQKVLCPENTATTSHFSRIGSKPGVVGINGWEFDATGATTTDFNFLQFAKANAGQDVTDRFKRAASDFPACKGLSFRIAQVVGSRIPMKAIPGMGRRNLPMSLRIVGVGIGSKGSARGVWNMLNT